MQRFREHVTEATVKNRKTILCNAIRKYGEHNFSVVLIEDNIPDDLIDEKEKYYIEYYKSHYSYHHGYNMTIGGKGTHGYIFTDECRKLQSENSFRMWEELRNNPEKLRNRNKKISEKLTNVPKSASHR